MLFLKIMLRGGDVLDSAFEDLVGFSRVGFRGVWSSNGNMLFVM